MEHCSRRMQCFIALCLSCLLVESSPTRRFGRRGGLPAFCIVGLSCSPERGRLAACKTLAKLQGLSGTAITDAVQHGRSSYDHSSDRSSGLNDAGIDRFLLGLDGCGIPVSSTSGNQHCALRHAHATCVETNLGGPRHRRDVVLLTAPARWRGASTPST